MTPEEFRAECRSGRYRHGTAGICPDYAQANLVIVPASLSTDFRRFCELNPKPCPILEITAEGDPHSKTMAPGADLRTDLPLYRIHEWGEMVAEPTDLVGVWRSDFVAFLLGCSFTFEAALLKAGLPVRHLDEKGPAGRPKNVPMYRTNMMCRSAGPFAGPMVVSMRPMTEEQADLATRVTLRYPDMHGAPVHRGDPSAIGIADLDQPDWGDPVTFRYAEIPVFWACGVTPQAVALAAEIPLVISHSPGCMFVTDRRHEEFDVESGPSPRESW